MLMTDIPFDFPELTAQAREAAACAANLAPWSILEAWRLFHTDLPRFFRALNAKPDSSLLYLFYYLQFTRFAYRKYQERKIPDDVFYHTFSDIGRWEKVCFEHTGAHGLEEYEWLSLHLRLQLFALGRLQFQPVCCPWDLPAVYGIQKGDPVLNVHIPSGSRLTPSACEASYQQAARFFNMQPAVFICHSWLLCPALKNLLPSGSNILQFQNEYTITGVDAESRQAEERIFGCLKSCPSEYPENSYLQKSAKTWLLSGNPLPAGYGVRRLFS